MHNAVLTVAILNVVGILRHDEFVGSGNLVPLRMRGKGTQLVATPATSIGRAAPRRAESMSLAYVGLSLFILIYCARPSDWLPGAAGIPFGKITGVLALAGFGVSIMLGGRGVLRLPREAFLLILLYGQLCLAVPFSIWPGGSFEIVKEYWKIVLITIVIIATVTSLARLRRLLFLQTASLAVMAVVIIWQYRGAARVHRAGGVVGGVFENPNELAVNLALIFPFCLAFLLGTRNPWSKAAWALVMALLGYMVMITYSRSGFLVLLTAVGVCVWEFGLKGRRPYLVVLVAIAGLAILLLSSPAQYAARIASIFYPEIEAAQDLGSSAVRRELLSRGLANTANNPFFGIGPGNFVVVSGLWRSTHNTYLQLSSEAGIPALILFLLILWSSFSNIRRTLQLTRGQVKHQLLGGALRAALISFMVGAFFTDFAYHFVPYFLVGYCSAHYQIARTSATRMAQSSQTTRAKADVGRKLYGRDDKPKMAWTAE